MEFIKNIISQNTLLSRIVKNTIFILALMISVFLTFVLSGIVFLSLLILFFFGLIIFTYLRLRSRLSGGRSPFFRSTKAFRGEPNAKTKRSKYSKDSNASDGPIIEAHNTPDGWSVED
ncbi:MAG: hypothetical protein P8N18_01640 [Hellea sp.]|nr:hypothetical protein [Hellea sp.]